ncbi:MAG TPA: HAD family hydrolase [Tepidisphaeraceae bacterium]
MRRPAVFFDRDNTLIIGNEYCGEPDKVALVAGAPGAVAKCRAMGFATVVASNQSGVARGMFDEDAVRACNRRMDELLLAANPAAVIDRHEYCPFHPEGTVDAYRSDSDLRKPRPGMILAAAEAMAIDLSRSWMIGDAPRDIAAGKAAGCRTILIDDPTLAPSPAALEKPTVAADFTVGTLVEAVEVVARHHNDPPHPAAPSAPPPAPAPPPAGRLQSITNPPRPAAARPTPPRPAPRPEPLRVHVDTSRLELANQQILIELKKLNDARADDFSVSKLIAGVVQVLALSAMLMAYFFFRNDTAVLQSWLLVGIFLQTFTIALLIMSRQK